MIQSPTCSFEGIIPPLATPLLDDGALDVASFERLIEHVIAGGVHGVFVLGTTGEGPVLGADLRRQVLREACRLVAGRIPVLVNVTDASVDESQRLLAMAAEAGASAGVVSPPFYFRYTQAQLAEAVRSIAAAAPLPIMLYNMPHLIATTFDVSTVAELSHDGRIVGLKDSSGDVRYLREVLAATAHRADWPVLVGSEAILVQAIEAGARGGVVGCGFLDPVASVALYQAARSGDGDAAARLSARIAQIGRIYAVAEREGICGLIAAAKTALVHMGILSHATMAPPSLSLDAARRQQIAQIVAELALRRLTPDEGCDVVITDRGVAAQSPRAQEPA